LELHAGLFSAGVHIGLATSLPSTSILMDENVTLPEAYTSTTRQRDRETERQRDRENSSHV
jgi:hypothetical protein